MAEQLKNFLNGSRREKNEPYNLVGMGNFAGRYYIDANMEEAFWKLYDAAMKKQYPVSLAECPMFQSILRIDIDITKNFEEETHLNVYIDFPKIDGDEYTIYGEMFGQLSEDEISKMMTVYGLTR